MKVQTPFLFYQVFYPPTDVFFFFLSFQDLIKDSTLPLVQFFLILTYMSFVLGDFHIDETIITKNLLRFLVAESLTSNAVIFLSVYFTLLMNSYI